MAKQNNNNNNNNIGLLRYLTFDKEARADDQVTKPIEGGRLKYILSTFRAHNSDLTLPNVLYLITLLPMIAVYVFLQIFTIEKASYVLNGINNIPYFMSGIGLGISSSSNLLEAQLNTLNVYYMYFLGLAVGFFIMSIGLAGLMRITMKFLWKDSFITKKDSYGNNVPRTVLEFFNGIKKYWWQMLVWGLIGMILIAGVSSSVIYFVGNFWAGTAGAGVYILLIFSIIVGVIGSMFLMFMPSMIVMYNIPFSAKIKNSLILTFQMFMPNLIVLAVIAAPILAIALTSGIANVVFVALIIVFGGSFYSILVGGYVQYYAEKIITPVANARANKSGKKKIKNNM